MGVTTSPILDLDEDLSIMVAEWVASGCHWVHGIPKCA